MLSPPKISGVFGNFRIEGKDGESMFTGLVRAMGTVREASASGKGRRLRIDLGPLAGSVGVGQSVAVNGACLTATAVSGSGAAFDAVAETLARTNLGALRPGDPVNLEPALKAGDALDGHVVLGHVDALAAVLAVDDANPDARTLRLAIPPDIRHLVAEKGSVAVDGVSLTVSRAGRDWFEAAVIPHTWANTTLSRRRPGDGVNLEADVLARYAARIMQHGGNRFDEDFLRENGFA